MDIHQRDRLKPPVNRRKRSPKPIKLARSSLYSVATAAALTAVAVCALNNREQISASYADLKGKLAVDIDTSIAKNQGITRDAKQDKQISQQAEPSESYKRVMAEVAALIDETFKRTESKIPRTLPSAWKDWKPEIVTFKGSEIRLPIFYPKETTTEYDQLFHKDWDREDESDVPAALAHK